MKTVQKIVGDLLNESPFIEDGLSDGYINLTALAKIFQPKIEKLSGKPVQTGAIVMAIKRFKTSNGTEMHKRKVLNYIANLGDIIIRTNLVDFTFKNSSDLLNRHQELLLSIKENPTIFHATSKGVYETNIITCSSMSTVIDDLFQKEHMLSKIDNLASLTMRLPLNLKCIPGIFYIIFKKLAGQNINIIELISTNNEFTIIVNQQDTNRAFEVLQNLKVNL
jgi:aspartokinase